MKRKNFAYYCILRSITGLEGNEKRTVSYYVSLRLEDTLLYAKELQAIVGLTGLDQVPADHRGITIDIERTFHCAASKKIAGHLSFSLEFTGEEGQEFPQWGRVLETSIAYDKSKLFTVIESALYGYTFKPKGSEAPYRIVQGTIKEKRRRGEG